MTSLTGTILCGTILAFGMQAAQAADASIVLAQAQSVASSATTMAVKMPAIPKGKETDVKFYAANAGGIVLGRDAFEQMPKVGLILWLAGNQFFAMDDVIGAFQKHHPQTSVGLITLPPGLLLQGIKAGGWIYGDREYRGQPDIYASVSLGHLKQLKASALMDSYIIYMQNEPQIMVAQGNPKKIAGVQDLARADVRTSMPNPVNEGIKQFYIRRVLERHGIWQTISGGKECVHCQTTANNWFTAVHHRETPDRILANQSDAGMVEDRGAGGIAARRPCRSGCATGRGQLAERGLLRDRHIEDVETPRSVGSVPRLLTLF